jgi:hypothetical protein
VTVSTPHQTQPTCRCSRDSATMGNCASSQEEVTAKQRSDEIDKQIDDDLRKLKKECKILLLGTFRRQLDYTPMLIIGARLGRVREDDHRKADEDHQPERIHTRRAPRLPSNHIQEPCRQCPGHHSPNAKTPNRLRGAGKQSAWSYTCSRYSF